jgi:hypothetical protein
MIADKVVPSMVPKGQRAFGHTVRNVRTVETKPGPIGLDFLLPALEKFYAQKESGR